MKMTKRKIHECPECDYLTDRSYSLRMHILSRHTDKTLSCQHPGCGYITNSPLNLKLHALRHLDVLPIACMEDGCDFRTTTNTQLMTHHKCMHEESKDFPCDHPGCTFTAKLEGNLKQHMVTHIVQLSFHCKENGCDFSTTSAIYLKRHEARHNERDKPYACNHGDCGYRSTNSTHLNIHMRIHRNERNYPCDFPICDLSFISASHLTRHKKTHSPDAQKYHKKQEKRVTKMLTQWGYNFDAETTINASRGNCLTDTNRHFSRLDYHILNATSAVVLLEVDEDQHYWYELSCELSRMADIRASLLKAGITKPIYWVRYNPNGKYHVDFEEVKISREKRELALKSKLEELCSPEFVPANEVSIHYLYYDLMSREMGPEITYDDAFPEVMRSIVSWK